MNNLSWRHHYIPKFYLNGFTSEQGQFKIFDVEKNQFVKEGKDFSPESYFFEKDGNTLISEKEKSDFLEGSYAKRDSAVAEIFNRINQSNGQEKFNLTDEDIAHIQYFIGVMHWRVPSNFDEIKSIIDRKKLKELGLILQDRTSGAKIEDEHMEMRIKHDPNFFKFMKAHFPAISFPELFECKTPLHILPFPKGLPSICSDNPIISRNPKTFRVYTDDLIFPINANKLFVRGQRSKDFYTSVKLSIDLITYKQAKHYASCTDEGYIDDLNDLFIKYGSNLDAVRSYVFDTMLR